MIIIHMQYNVHNMPSHFKTILGFVFLIIIGQNLTAQVDSTKVAIQRFSAITSDARVNKTYIDDRNVIWLASNRGLIETVSDGSKAKTYLENTEILDVVSDRRNNVWAASQNALHQLSNNQRYQLPTDATITDIAYLEGSVWVGTTNGLFEFNPTAGKFKTHDTRNTPMISTNINFVHADRNKVLWVGTDKGYLRLEEENWNLEDKKVQMLATCENNEGQWIITNKDMFLINKFNRLFPVRLDPTQYKGKINNFVIDSKGRIYIASDILVRYDPYKEVIDNYTEDAASLSKACLSLACDKNDNIWIGTDGAGFYKLQFGELATEELNAVVIIESNIPCPGNKTGAIKVSVSGGAKPYSYQWSKVGVNGNYISSLPAGEYYVTVTDKIQNSTIANINLVDPSPVRIELVSTGRVTTPEDPNGTIEINISGGAGQYTYLWSTGATTQNVNKLPSGLYSLTAKDKNGCMSTATFNVKRDKYIPDLEMTKIVLGQKLRINDLNFDSDSSSITRANFEILDEVYEFLNANESVSVEIGGHTNTIPPHEYCDKLSAARSRNVAEYLYDRGIAKSRVAYKGYGKREPLSDSTSLAGRQKNQRVEIKILTI
jgi:outer membrane protein OmpA-like peptidoglycan-associated protein